MTIRRVDERYALEMEIGRGGSGPVWLGHDDVLGRRVAIKRIGLPPGAEDADALRAEREARLAARVNHPHVVAVFDLVATGDDHWLVMEYVEGTTLARRIREEGPLSPDAAAPVLLQAAEALAAAHAAGIVHRDVKPSNILIDRDGVVKLSDFGIARAVADAALTQTGLVTGSPAYLSPEVASGASATPASDVWSFGATLFHTLAGTPPYDVGENLMGALYRIVHDDPPRLTTAGPLSPLLDATMAKRPEDRPGMDDVVSYLRAHGDRPAAPTTAPPTAAGPAPAAPVSVPRPDSAPRPVAETEPATSLLAAMTGEVWGPESSAPHGAERSSATARRRPPRALWLAAAAVVVIGLIGALLLAQATGGDDTPRAQDDATGGTAPSADSSATASAPTSAPPEPPSAAEMEQFARDYVRTASRDPDAGFEFLTPAYQRRSPRYRNFWGNVRGATFREVSADPASMSVTYTYSYTLAGSGRRTETVTLNLVQDADRLLIASATVG